MNTVPADARYRSSGCQMPFLRMHTTVPADAEYRSSGCGVPFLRMPKRLTKLTENPRQYLISALAKNVPNLFLIFFNQARSRFVHLFHKAIFTSHRSQTAQMTYLRSSVPNRQKRFGRRGVTRQIGVFSDKAVEVSRQPKRASANPNPRTPCRPLSAVRVSDRNCFVRNFQVCLPCDEISTLVSTMQPCRPHPACVWFGNSRSVTCRNSGQIKVATPRAAHLNLSPRCGDLAGEPSLLDANDPIFNDRVLIVDADTSIPKKAAKRGNTAKLPCAKGASGTDRSPENAAHCIYPQGKPHRSSCPRS